MICCCKHLLFQSMIDHWSAGYSLLVFTVMVAQVMALRSVLSLSIIMARVFVSFNSHGGSGYGTQVRIIHIRNYGARAFLAAVHYSCCCRVEVTWVRFSESHCIIIKDVRKWLIHNIAATKIVRVQSWLITMHI